MTSTQLHGKDGSLDLGIAILRWLRLLVSPVTAVETISLSCVRVQQQQCPKFRVQLVDVAPVRCNRFEWGPVIERALRLHPQLNSCVKDVIEMIDERAKGDLGPAQRTHLREFGGQAFVTEKGVPHCEFVTACLLRDLKRAIPVKGRDLIFDVHSLNLLKSNTTHLTSFTGGQASGHIGITALLSGLLGVPPRCRSPCPLWSPGISPQNVPGSTTTVDA
jgi:hypothetical protein